MFGFARYIVQHKVGAVAVIALAVVVFAPAQDEQAGPSNPWSAHSPGPQVAAEDPGIIDQMVEEADTMLAESGYDPRDSADEAVGGFDDTASQYESANAD